MCKLIEISRDAVPSNIFIEFERAATLRATKVVVVNRDRHDEETGVVLVCYDNGEITVGGESAGQRLDGGDLACAY